jgi:hypothetical protein
MQNETKEQKDGFKESGFGLSTEGIQEWPPKTFVQKKLEVDFEPLSPPSPVLVNTLKSMS